MIVNGRKVPWYLHPAVALVLLVVLSATLGGAFMHKLTLWRYVGPAQPRFYASSLQDVREALELAGVQKGETVFDLGCGDGRVPITAVREFGARGVCVELNGELVMLARANAAGLGVGGQIEFRQEDLFSTDVADADVVVLFLSPEFNARLEPLLQERLAPGTRVVSISHPMPGTWPVVRERRFQDREGVERVVRLFHVPPRRPVQARAGELGGE